MKCELFKSRLNGISHERTCEINNCKTCRSEPCSASVLTYHEETTEMPCQRCSRWMLLLAMRADVHKSREMESERRRSRGKDRDQRHQVLSVRRPCCVLPQLSRVRFAHSESSSPCRSSTSIVLMAAIDMFSKTRTPSCSQWLNRSTSYDHG